MTISQTLDQIFVSYQKKDMDKFPDVTRLRVKLIEMKIQWGGNTNVENEDTVNNIIKYGSVNPKDWE